MSMSRARDVANFIPAGGAAGDVLTKTTAADYDTEWSPGGGGGGGLPPIRPIGDRGKALVVNATNAAEWGAPINNAGQIVDGGGFS